MTSDKSGHAGTASSALEEDLDDTRVRKDTTGDQTSADASGTKRPGATPGENSGRGPNVAAGSGATSNGATSNGATGQGKNADLLSGPVAVPAPPAAASTPSARGEAGSRAAAPVPPAPDEPGSTVPTTGGVWRSAYEAGRDGKESKPPAPAASEATEKPAAPASSEPKAAPGLVSAIGRASAKAGSPTPQSAAAQEPDANAESWNRVPAPGAPPAPPTGATEGTDGVRAGAMKAAQAALDAARSAAKKVTSIMPDEEGRTESAVNDAKTRPEMHYTAAGVRGTATPVGAPASGAPRPQDPAQPASGATPEVPRQAPAGPRRVRLAVSRVDPWSVMKLAFLLAVAIAIMTVVATAVFWSVLDSLGVFTTVQEFVAEAVGPQSNVNLTQFVEFPRVISLATLISICNVVLLTAIATIMAFLYNITAALVGGVHMTLTDD